MPLRLLISVLTTLVALLVGLGSGCQEHEEAPAPTQAVPDPGAGAIRTQGAPARLGVLERELSATGMSSAWRDANLRAEVGGRVLEITVDNGDVVEAGTLLLRIDGSRQRLAVSGASARKQALEHDLELAQTDYDRKLGLVNKGSLAAAQLDGAEHAVERAQAALDGARADLGSARRSSKDARLSAPIEGIVTRRMVDVGDTIAPGTPLLDLVDLSKIRVRVGLAGSELAGLDREARATVIVEDLGGTRFPATFAALAPAADPVTGLFDIEYHVENPEQSIRGGMVVTITLPLRESVERVLVPRAALTRRDGRLAVFVLAPGSVEQQSQLGEGLERRVAELREVQIGAYGDRDVELLTGVEAGEVVATSAQHALAEAVLVELQAQAAPAPAPAVDAAGPEPEAAP